MNTLEKNLKKHQLYLGNFQVEDYMCFPNQQLPDNLLGLYYVDQENKIYVYQDEQVFGRLKLNELEQKYITAILCSGRDILECRKAPSDVNASLEQKFHVCIWIKDNSEQETKQPTQGTSSQGNMQQ